MRIYIFLLSFLISITGFSQDLLPKSGGEIIKHTYYTLSYSEQNEQAFWVYYELTPEMVNGKEERTDNFRSDPMVMTGSADLEDYRGSGYHRGHLCPAGSMDMNHTSMSESFFFSNMSPQAPSFNTGKWKTLEEQIRTWVNLYDKLIVVSGPVFKDNIGQIGFNKVTVPGYYYKVIYCPQKQQMIAFVMQNKKLSEPITTYIKSVDEVEALTGIDFFYDMDNSIEDKMEAISNISVWDFGKTKAIATPQKQESKSVQCKGIAKSTGKRCKQMTTNPNGYCRYHQGQAGK